MAFKNNYSEFYDLLYENKEYGKEADYVHDLIEQNLNGSKNTTILDLACGTGKQLKVVTSAIVRLIFTIIRFRNPTTLKQHIMW